MEDVYITGALRTPIGKFGGSLARLTAVELGIIAATSAIAKSGVPAQEVEETFIGQARQAGCGPNPGRQIAVRAGIPHESPAATINQACASGLRAVTIAFDTIRLGRASVVLAGGTESMSNAPYLLTRARYGYRLGHGELLDVNFKDGFDCPLAEQRMGRTAETLAEQYRISREDQDRIALTSQKRAAAAEERLNPEKIPVPLKDKKKGTVDFITDEHVRGATSMEELSQLPPAFKEGGTVHAGNSSGITDGAAAMLVMSESALKRHKGKPMARIIDYTVAGVDPKIMGIGPVPAVRQLVERTGIGLDQIDLIEINEAFAAQVLACQRELKFDMEKANVNGGAIALGHPIGCSGARIVVTLLYEMERRSARYGLATLCVSGGMGMAMLVERV